MKAVTVTLNPALDRALYVNGLVTGELNRADAVTVDLGSKGINVSRVLALYGVSAEAIAFAGGTPGEEFRRMLQAERIPCSLIPTAAPTRINIKIIDTQTGEGTEVNERGGPVTAAEVQQLLAVTEERLRGGLDAIFLGGSIPAGIEKKIWAEMTALGRRYGAKVFLDCDGEALLRGLEEKPYAIKPNLLELSHITGRIAGSPEEAAADARKIYRETGVQVLCTLGGSGSLAAGPDGVFIASCPQVTVRGFAAAGDTFLATYVWRRYSGCTVPDALRYASGAASAKVECPGTSLPAPEELTKFINTIEVRAV